MELGCRARAAGAKRGSLAKECDISEAAATSGEGAEGAQLTEGRAQDGTGKGGTPRPQHWDGSADSHHSRDSHPGWWSSRCRGAGRAWGRSGTWGVGAAPHQTRGEWCSASSNPSPRLKITPRLPTVLRPSELHLVGERHQTGRHLDWGATAALAPLAGTQHPGAAGRGRRGARYCWLGVAGVTSVGRGAADHAPSTGT